MLRLRFNFRHVHRLRRAFSSAPPPSPSHLDPSTNLNKPQLVPSSSPSQSAQGPLPPIYTTEATSPPSSSLSRKSVFALSTVVLSAAVASAAIFSAGDDQSDGDRVQNRVYESVGHAIQKSGDSFRRAVDHARQTGVAASILWQSLTSVLSSANHEVRVGFELRVAALLADIASTNAGRRAALVAAGRGAVVDWLLETVAAPGDRVGTQDEAARALAYLIADPNVSKDALGRPKAVPNLLKFIFSCQPKAKKRPRRSSFNISASLKGRSMLVAAIMDIVTSNCENVKKMAFKPSLPGNAEMRDIAAAIQVIEEGGIYFDDPNKSDDNDDGRGGMRGIGIKILEGTTVLGLSRTSGLMELNHPDANTVEETPRTLALLSKHDNSQAQANLSSAVIPGLWDDLHCQHVAVPFAAWALANWAMASHTNRSHIQELDHDGEVVMTALMAPERTVKWHGSLVARLLLEDPTLELNDSVSDWSSSLLATVSHATKNDDISLAQVALSAFLVSVDRSERAQKIVMEKGLHLLRDSAKRTRKHKMLQEGLAKVLELLCSGDMHLSLEESQKWSDILLSWVLGKVASNTTQYSATKILSRILEDYGPFSVSISQGWLALIMNEIVNSSKTSSAKGAVSPKNEKMKIQLDQSKVVSATQSTNQLAGAVVNLASAQLGTVTDSVDTFPLADLLSLEPFAGSFKSLKKDNPPKFNAADSAFTTLKAIKSLTEFCAEDSVCQSKIVDFGVLCLLRRFLICDDYEKLAAIEAYDASRALEAQERVSDGHTESTVKDTHDPSSVRVPASAHIRRHAARLLTILSLLPQVQKAIIADGTWCKWLNDCAGGKIPGCNDLKVQSYAKASLLNVFCNHQDGSDSGNDSIQKSDTKSNCPRFGDKIFLINPGLPHWKCPEMVHQSGEKKESSSNDTEITWFGDEIGDPFSNISSLSGYMHTSGSGSRMHAPEFDVVFVHGLRGGPYKTWRIAEDKSSTKSGLVENIDQEAGKMGSFWPGEWLSDDFPQARLFTLKYKTNLTQWSGDTLPLQEVSSMLLEKLLAAGIGDRPVVFVTHSMGGLVVKQILHKAKAGNNDKLVNNTVGIVFYSCPHLGSKLADMPCRMGVVLRPAPSIEELRSGSPRLVELNNFIRQLHKKQILEVLSLCETEVTPIVEGYGGRALRMEIVPIESADPGFGELVKLESTDHINSCKPMNRSDPSYTEILKFLQKLNAQHPRS